MLSVGIKDGLRWVCITPFVSYSELGYDQYVQVRLAHCNTFLGSYPQTRTSVISALIFRGS